MPRSKYPTLYTLDELERAKRSGVTRRVSGGYVPVRPEGMPTLKNRLRCAWLVLTGRADAVTWEGGQ